MARIHGRVEKVTERDVCGVICRQSGRVVGAQELKSGSRGFVSCSDH